MTPPPVYASCLADHLSAYIALRRGLGYELRSQIYVLRQFDRVVAREMPTPGPVTRAVVEAFLRSLAGLQPITRRLRLSTIRQFLLYLRQVEPETFVPERSLEPARSSPRAPHIYTDEEIQALLRAARRYPCRYPARRWLLYPTLIAFLYVTGMRVSEALALTLGDIDWRQGLVHIRRTKFHKARLVPLTPSSCEGLRRYLCARAERGHGTTPDAPVFVGVGIGRLPYRTALGAFRSIVRTAGVGASTGTRPPRLHDLRHTAAVKRLSLWYCDGSDVQALLPVLVTYLGHSAIRCTEIYLTTTAELLAEAGARYERCFQLDAMADRGGLNG
jgi:integrase